jgi:hypothetical protein
VLFLGELHVKREWKSLRWWQNTISWWEKYGAWVTAAFFYVVIMVVVSRQHMLPSTTVPRI